MSDLRVCIKCVMDESASDIVFDGNGQCNFCKDFEKLLASGWSKEERSDRYNLLIRDVKDNGKGKRYDCIVGVSGGVDSSYSLYLAVRAGLRPLAVHLDNGWNSELASHNIANLVKRLGVDLFTHVIDWKENRDLQRSMFFADVIDIEMLMDSAMLSTNYWAARKFGVKYILSGSNTVTEGIKMPRGWNHSKYDKVNVKSIQDRFGKIRIKTHPLYSYNNFRIDHHLRGIRWVPFLDYIDYNKSVAVEDLKILGYRPYPYKHYESVFTRFYQACILPEKFAVDKRRLHLSALVISGQMSRVDALTMLDSDPYPDPVQKIDDRQFVLKKLGLSEAEFDAYIARPPIAHSAYPSEVARAQKSGETLRALKRLFTFPRRSR